MVKRKCKSRGNEGRERKMRGRRGESRGLWKRVTKLTGSRRKKTKWKRRNEGIKA